MLVSGSPGGTHIPAAVLRVITGVIEFDLNKKILECLKTELDLIIIFGANAIKGTEDIIPKVIKEAGGKIIRFGMPVEPGNLILIGTIIKENNTRLSLSMLIVK